MQQVKYINGNGTAIHLGIERPFVLQSIDGTSDVDVDIKTIKTPMTDGNLFSKAIVGMRYLSLRVSIVAPTENELAEKRRQLSNIFNPKLGEGVLEYTLANTTKKIKVVVDSAPTFSKYNGQTTTVLIDLLCPNPYWMDMEQEEYRFETPFTSMFEFPFFTTDEGIMFGYESETRVFTNHGDVDAPLIIEFEGGVKNVLLTNQTTGKYIKIEKMIDDDKSVLVDSSHGSKEVSLLSSNGTKKNALGYLTLDSSFLELVSGENVLQYTAHNEESINSYLQLRWNNLYIGI